MEHILESDHGKQMNRLIKQTTNIYLHLGSPANNWEIVSRTTDRIWTLSWNMDRDYGFIYVKRDN